MTSELLDQALVEEATKKSGLVWVQGPDGPYPSWLHVHLRKETELQGRFVGQFGSVRNLTRIDYRDGTLTAEMPVQYEQNKSDLRFEGKLAGGTLQGTTQGADGKTSSRSRGSASRSSCMARRSSTGR